MSTHHDQMNIVIVGHVDHGKSTFIGRLLADTKSLPNGKLEQVKATCAANAKPFEYAFLLDALKDEQAQGITIDTARVFFKTKKRHYIILDAPGHIEFLKNMITGAARAEAALLLIDAHEGVKENSRRHGYMLAMLGIKQVTVLVNKMDLVDYKQDVFEKVKKEYASFLKDIQVAPKAFVPIAAFHGENLNQSSKKMSWYKGKDVLTHMDNFQKEPSKNSKPFRLPVQDIYKFTEQNDDRRIIAGSVETGSLSIGDEVIFLPSEKKSTVKNFETFNASNPLNIKAGEAVGITLETQIYTKPGELMCKVGEEMPQTGTTFKANIFWLGKKPMIKDKRYKLKCASTRAPIYIKDIINVMDASDLSQSNKQQIDRHDVASVMFQTTKPIAFDLTATIEGTSRFVIVDDYEIAGGGIIVESIEESKTHFEDVLEKREFKWERGNVSESERERVLGQKAKFIVIAGPEGIGKIALAKALEKKLFSIGRSAYYLGISNILLGLSADMRHKVEDRDEHIRRLGEIAHLFTDAGLIVISTITELEDYEAKSLKTLNQPKEIVYVTMGQTSLNKFKPDLHLKTESAEEKKVEAIVNLLKERAVIADFSI